MENEKVWMQRALALAKLGEGNVSPNPMVGCVIVHNDLIIGEGYHREYGGPHAEVNAINAVFENNKEHLLSKAVVYVSLEPCSHFGNTPPCADLLIKHQVQQVVICNLDPNPKVSGQGMGRLKKSGISVRHGLMEADGEALNKRFFTTMRKKRPYIILKWAETADGFLGNLEGSSIKISGIASNRMVHQWRSQEDGILIGSNTASNDNPFLNVRNWVGNNPVRIVLDRNLKLDETLHIFEKVQPTLIVNYQEETPCPIWPNRYSYDQQIHYLKINKGDQELDELLTKLLNHKINSVIVEGGVAVLNAFLEAGLWDEIRRCQGLIVLGDGIKAPLAKGKLNDFERVGDDLWTYYLP